MMRVRLVTDFAGDATMQAAILALTLSGCTFIGARGQSTPPHHMGLSPSPSALKQPRGHSMKRAFHKAACASAMLLSACATVPPPEPQIVIRELKIPVPVACVDPASVPIEPGSLVLPLNDARAAADIAASQALKYKAYARELYALIVPACTAAPR